MEKEKKRKCFEELLKKSAVEWFRDKKIIPSASNNYYFDIEQWRKNIISQDVANYVAEKVENKKIKLHPWVHNALSSQAMAFNLIVPMALKSDFSPIVDALNKKYSCSIGTINSCGFEYSDSEVFNEGKSPTSIDVAFFSEKDNSRKIEICMEVKLKESDFGNCSIFSEGDCSGESPVVKKGKNVCYLDSQGLTYWEKMKKYGFLKGIINEKQCVFASHYQFFREVLFALEKNAYFVLLHDERSPVFNGLFPFLLEFVPACHKEKVLSISVQDIVKMGSSFVEFKKKYGL